LSLTDFYRLEATLQSLSDSTSQAQQSNTEFPEPVNGWRCPGHDLALLMAIRDKGIEFLKDIKKEDHYQM
jgi:hypothetical protein